MITLSTPIFLKRILPVAVLILVAVTTFSVSSHAYIQSISLSVSESADDMRNTAGNRVAVAATPTQYLGNFSGTDYWAGWRWQNVPVPVGSTISSATLDLYSAGLADGSNAQIVFFGNAADDATAYNTSDNKPELKERTNAFVSQSFSPSQWTSSQGFGVQTTDVTDIVQEIVSRGGWREGNALAIMAHDNGSGYNNYIGFSTYDRHPNRGARLTIAYSVPQQPASAPLNAPDNLSATVLDTNVIELTWNDNTSDEGGFYIERIESDGTYHLLDTTPTNGTQYRDSGLVPGTTYRYRVAAYRGNDVSEYSNSVQATTRQSNSWNSSVMAWVYPGRPACGASSELADGRVVHILKSEYYTVSRDGTLVPLLESTSGCNGFSTEVIDRSRLVSQHQFVTVSSGVSSMTALVSSPESRSAAITTLIDFVTAHGFAGVEIDFEGFASWSSIDYADYKSFATELGDALHASDKLLMIDGPPISDTREQGYYEWKYEDFNTLPVDYIVVMAYDYMYDWGAGEPIAPNAWVIDIISWMSERILDTDRIVMGIPAYGYHGLTGNYYFSLDTKAESETYPGYHLAERDPDSFEMMWEYDGETFTYQDTESLNSKRQLIEDNGIRTISVFHVGGNAWFSGREEQPDYVLPSPYSPSPSDGNTPGSNTSESPSSGSPSDNSSSDTSGESVAEFIRRTIDTVRNSLPR